FRRLPSPRSGWPCEHTCELGETILRAPAADGTVGAELSLLPNPPILVDDKVVVPLGWTVEVWFPGRTTQPVGLVSDPNLSPVVNSGLTPITRRDGAKLTGVRALCRCPDRRLRWFPLSEARLPADPLLPAVAVVAEGCAARLLEAGRDAIV